MWAIKSSPLYGRLGKRNPEQHDNNGRGTQNKRCGKISHGVFVAFINIDDNALIKYRLGVEIHRPQLAGNGVQIISKKIFTGTTTGNSPFSLSGKLSEPIALIDQNKNDAFVITQDDSSSPVDRRPGFSNFPENELIFSHRFVSTCYMDFRTNIFLAFAVNVLCVRLRHGQQHEYDRV